MRQRVSACDGGSRRDSRRKWVAWEVLSGRRCAATLRCQVQLGNDRCVALGSALRGLVRDDRGLAEFVADPEMRR